MWYNSARISIQSPFKSSSKKGKKQPFFTQPMGETSLLKEEAQGESSLSLVVTSLANLHSFDEPHSLFEKSIDLMLTATQAQSGSIFLWDETAKELVLKVRRGTYLSKVPDARVRLREGISGWVAHHGLSVLVKNIGQDERFREIKRSRSYHSPSFISLPLLSHHKLLGVINITEKENLAPFDEQDFEWAEAIARYISIAFENLKAKKRLSIENEKLSREVVHLKASLRTLEPMAAIGKLACNLAHELNNPLDAIRRFVNLALDHVLEDSLAREYLLKAKQGIRRSVQVIRGLLSFSRETNTPVHQRVELHSLIEKSLAPMIQSPLFEKIQFQKDFSGKTVYVVDGGLTTVFKNLFENARHAMKGSGVIAVSTHPNGESVIVSIRDTGCGVPAEHQKRLFEPFFTTKDGGEGTGIGLSICREIVERVGGEITFESAENRGATFFVKLPYESNGEKA